MTHLEVLGLAIVGAIGMLSLVVLVAGLCRLALFLIMIKPAYRNLPISKRAAK